MLSFKHYIVLLLSLLFLPAETHGQFLVNKGNTITVTDNTILTVVGGVQNEGELHNKGQISVTENWLNANTYLANSGWLVFNGNGDQFIDNNNQGVYAMSMDGGGNKWIQSNLNIIEGGEIQFNNGIVGLEVNILLTLQQDVTVTGGSVNSYVDGALFHQGMGYKLFPIGKNGRYRPVELDNVTGNNPNIGMEVFEGNWAPKRDYDLDEVSGIRYWRMIHISDPADFAGSIISLSTGDDEPFTRINELVVSQADSVGDIFRGLGQASFEGDMTSGKVTSENLVTKPIFALAKSSIITLNNLLFVPNAFSPKSYNQHERGIKVYGQEVSEEAFDFKIFDRWGNILYSTRSFIEANQIGWLVRATKDLKGLQSFKYTLSGKFTNGIPFGRVGSIRLIK